MFDPSSGLNTSASESAIWWPIRWPAISIAISGMPARNPITAPIMNSPPIMTACSAMVPSGISRNSGGTKPNIAAATPAASSARNRTGTLALASSGVKINSPSTRLNTSSQGPKFSR